MFREGYYLEIIKAKQSAATAVITVKEKTVELKSKKKITTNKWLTLDDWASLYEVLEKALLQNLSRSRSTSEKTKRTRHLEVSYTFEAPEDPEDRTSLPTIRVGVSPLRKKSKSSRSRREETTSAALSLDVFSYETCSKVEEYVPDGRNEGCESKVGYVPSRKSTLQYLQQAENSNEYVPSLIRDDVVTEALYVPNSVPRAAANLGDTYEPSSLGVRDNKGSRDEYIPNSKGVRKKVDEYQPDFTSKSMKFDDSYVPSSSKRIRELKKNDRLKSLTGRGKGKTKGIEAEKRSKESNASDSSASTASGSLGKKNSGLGQSEIKREM